MTSISISADVDLDEIAEYAPLDELMDSISALHDVVDMLQALYPEADRDVLIHIVDRLDTEKKYNVCKKCVQCCCCGCDHAERRKELEQQCAENNFKCERCLAEKCPDRAVPHEDEEGK